MNLRCLYLVFWLLLTSMFCRDYQYFDDMHYSESVDAQKRSKIGGRLGNMLPPDNTVSYKQKEYNLTNNANDYIKADQQLSSPFKRVTKDILNKGKDQYRIYCSPCHGLSGKGDGLVQKKADWAAVRPLVKVEGKETRSLTWGEGRLYHVIKVGIGIMQNYDAQIQEENKWAIAHYVKYLQSKK